MLLKKRLAALGNTWYFFNRCSAFQILCPARKYLKTRISNLRTLFLLFFDYSCTILGLSSMGMFVNTILYQFSSTAVAIYGILLKVQNLAQIGVQGMNNGLIPIISYNYGAKNKERIQETIRCAFMYAAIVMGVILIVLELIPDKILLLFDASDQMLQIGIPAVRIMSVSFFVSFAGITFAAIFQGFGNGSYSMYLAFMRQVILLIPILLLGAFMGNLTVIWSGFVIAEGLSIPFGIVLYRKIKRNIIAPMKGNIEKIPKVMEDVYKMGKHVLLIICLWNLV